MFPLKADFETGRHYYDMQAARRYPPHDSSLHAWGDLARGWRYPAAGLGRKPRIYSGVERLMQHYFADVKGLGNVAVSRHAQDQIVRYGIPEAVFTRTLLEPIKPDIFEGTDIIWRERDGLRIVILANPEPFHGAKLVKTVYRVAEQAQARPKR